MSCAAMLLYGSDSSSATGVTAAAAVTLQPLGRRTGAHGVEEVIADPTAGSGVATGVSTTVACANASYRFLTPPLINLSVSAPWISPRTGVTGVVMGALVAAGVGVAGVGVTGVTGAMTGVITGVYAAAA